jgi:hypothetical protein
MMHKEVRRMLGVLVLLASFVAAGEAEAARRVGLGVGRGTRVSGLSVRVPGRTAVQVNAGWWDRGGYGVSADGLMDIVVASGSVLSLSVELGAGAGVGFDERIEATGALVGGLRFELMPLPIDIAVEYRPLLDILPTVELDPGYFGGHIRIYF